MPSAILPKDVFAVLSKPADGIIGVVDGVLALAAKQPVRIEWSEGGCQVETGGATESIPFRKSVFRAMLARIAVLCDEQVPGKVSPYGGSGTISHHQDRLEATFTNTTQEQSLDLQPVAKALPQLTGISLVQGATTACPA